MIEGGHKINNFSAFDEIDKPSSKIIQDCVHCGFCLSACPTYLETGNELDSPRGRIYLIKSGVEGEIPMGDSLVEHLDLCLGCLACETACPSGVKYSHLIEKSRSQIERRYERGWFDKIFRASLFKIFPYSSRLRLLLPLFYLINKIGLKSLLKPDLLEKISKRFASLYSMLPEIDSPTTVDLPKYIPSKNKSRFKIALLSGCIQSVFFSTINSATVNVLSQNGCDIHIPEDQGCCGALSVHSGRLEEGRNFARKLIDNFLKLDIDYVIVNSAGCGSTMKDYYEILKDDHKYQAKALEFCNKTRDIMEFLDEVGIESSLHEINLSVTYQDACHIVHGQKIKDEPRKLLNKIPGLNLIEMKQSDHCCGSAGIYNILQPDISDKILEKKIDNILETNPDYILAGNPGCLLQVQKGLSKRHKKIKIAHPIEILSWSISGNIL